MTREPWPAVARMVIDPQAPTAPLDQFREEYDKDDHLWWKVSCGHHQNLFDEALDLIEEYESKLRGALSEP